MDLWQVTLEHERVAYNYREFTCPRDYTRYMMIDLFDITYEHAEHLLTAYVLGHLEPGGYDMVMIEVAQRAVQNGWMPRGAR